jgi:glycosyltransferase involved in cell wall biosynthesis
MAAPTLSVVMPVFNEERQLPATIDALATAVDRSGFDAELLVVDDGSTDASAEVVRASALGRIVFHVDRQGNRGRFVARRVGLSAAMGEYVLFVDARVRLFPDALRFVHGRLPEERVWNGHVHVEADSILGDFWRLLAELAWRDYFDDPRTTSFGLADFDRYPKGTTCFFAPRELVESAFARFATRYSDIRLANDDTPILRAIASSERIHISPEFACVYSPRTTAAAFARHAFHRGVVFVDGHATPSSRFLPYVVAFFPLSAALARAAVRRPAVIPAAAAGCGVVAAAYGARTGRTSRELATLAVATPLYAVAHGLGMWRGLAEIVRARLAR